MRAGAGKIAACLLAAALISGGCGRAEGQAAETVERVSIDEVLPKKPEPPKTAAVKEFERISLMIPDRWRSEKADDNTAFIDDEEHCAYMYCGCSWDKWLAPDRVLAQYIEKLPEGAEVAEKVSDTKKDKNGIEYQTAAISYRSGGNLCVLKFIFSQENREFWLLKGESIDAEPRKKAVLLGELAELADTALLTETEGAAAGDKLSGRTWVVSGLDNYVLELKSGGGFLLYTEIETIDDVCTSGTYRVIRGREALDYLRENVEGVTVENIALEVRENCHDYNALCCLILNVEEVWRWGTKANSRSYDRVYYGTLREDGRLDMFDCLQFIELTFTPKE